MSVELGPQDARKLPYYSRIGRKLGVGLGFGGLGFVKTVILSRVDMGGDSLSGTWRWLSHFQPFCLKVLVQYRFEKALKSLEGLQESCLHKGDKV